MDEQMLHELEAAAAVMLSPPNVVSKEQRQQSEQIFMNFRKVKPDVALQLCQMVLEQSRIEFCIFEACNVLKQAIVVGWQFISDADKIALRQYLLNYIMTRELASFVREKILQVIAIMIKRTSIEDQGLERASILAEAKRMIQTGDVAQKSLACSITLALMQEYVNTVKSDDTGLTFDEHFKAKKQFENSDMKKVFVATLEAIEELLRADPLHVALLRQYLDIMEIIFTWGYISPIIPKKLITLCESVTKTNQAPPLRLCLSWKEIILESRVLEVFFFTYWKCREVPELRPKALTCLVQLSTLSGPVLNDDKQRRLAYLINYLSQFLRLTASTELEAQEALSFSMIVRKLLMFHHSGEELYEANHPLFSSLLQQMHAMTLKFIDGSAMEEALCSEDTQFIEAAENMLESWVLLMQAKENFAVDTLTPFIPDMFNRYVQCHLAPPDGLRDAGRILDAVEISEHDEKDRDRFREQLIIIGCFGREAPEHSLSILARLLEAKVRAFGLLLHRIHTSNSSQITIDDSKVLETLYEDLHWLLLITGHTIAMEAESETPLIPKEINDMLAQKLGAGAIDLPTSLQMLAAPNKDISEFPSAETAADPIIRLVAAVFRLCELEKGAVEVKMARFLSPELSSTLMWFLKMWADSYLLPLPEFYGQLADSIKVAFGADTEGGAWTVSYLLNKICLNIQHFSAEEHVIEDTVSLFLAILRRKHRCLPVFNSEIFKTILDLKDSTLPAPAKRGLLKGFVQIAPSLTDAAVRKQYLDQIMRPIAERYTQLTHQPNLSAIYQNEDVKQSLISTLEEVKGCIQGAYFHSSSNLFENFGQQLFAELPNLLDLYRNYAVIVELILEVLCETIINVHPSTIAHTSSSDRALTLSFYQCSMDVLRVWIKNNATQISVESKNYDDCPTDLILILRLMNSLLSKTLIEDIEEEGALDASQVVIFGLTHILPLITIDLIKFPEFCSQYYRTITLFIDSKSHRVATLPHELLKQILCSVELGLNSFTSDIQSLCFDFLQAMASIVYFDRNPASFMYAATLPFLKLVFDLIFGQQVDSENRTECYNALFALCCAYQEPYRQLMQNLIDAQPTRANADRLRQEWADLSAAVELVNNRVQKAKFLDRFDRFITNISFIYKV